ncbi:hypothetical protein R9C00_06440 [Flammeovirgaceae bacterium SG7u.111]|nr:hypothetical protein [Flammeovirgaceae bacterium SG7u.132]WPO37080.1 hypothetical protein R9C00_06440 [Flammeovirgaceae bacterium SG7u.111]
MKNHLISIKSLLVAVVFGALAMSCENNGMDDVSPEEILDATTFSENTFSEMELELDEATDNLGASNERGGITWGKNGCATRTIEEPAEGGYPKTITLEFGEDCENAAGKSKSGKIIITLTAEKGTVGAQKIVEFENYEVNGYAIEGKRTFTYLGEYTHTVVLEGGKITTPEGEVITREAEKERKMVEGMDTEARADNVFEITGTVSGTVEGVAYTKTITSPLVSKVTCPWIVSGTIESVVSEATSVVDFGDGTCDNLATRTVDGETEEFEMEFRIKRRMLKRMKSSK